ncbi:VOC family protein [Brevibacillus sp. TJ4]|uniref:VOC family protein n=1 Tax=Brevibacillus sp. TJ4 TaxID=3234853 RepID=UPI0037CFB2B3
MAYQAKQIYVNLPVKDLQKSMEFFTRLGFTFDPNFTDDKAGCLVIGDNIYAMLISEPLFRTFTKKEITDAAKTTEVIVALSANSKEEVDELVQKALEAGGSFSNDVVDHGFMYYGSFQDLDNHMWEILYMDPNAAQQTE